MKASKGRCGERRLAGVGTGVRDGGGRDTDVATREPRAGPEFSKPHVGGRCSQHLLSKNYRGMDEREAKGPY